MWTFETAVQFGQALEQIRRHETDLHSVRQDVAKVQGEVADVKAFLIRGALLATLWAAGGTLHWSAESVGEALGSAIKAMRK